jgi:nitrous oxide reductase accessory protein NosL
MNRIFPALFLAMLAQWGLACDSAEVPLSRAEIGPEAIANQEDAVCGMLVREQSAPRAQVIHRDGTRAFFCSVADLLAYLEAPSPHGTVLRTYLEVMEPDESPTRSHTRAHPWSEAGQASFVVGLKRPSIMGPPVMVYRDPDAAALAQGGNPNTRILDFDGLQDWWRHRQSNTEAPAREGSRVGI